MRRARPYPTKAAWAAYEGREAFGKLRIEECPHPYGSDARKAWQSGWYAAMREYQRQAQCQWFALCENPANGNMSHPVLGSVPICDHCRAKVEALS